MKLSDAEWTVMNAVWLDAPATAREVLERTEDATGWAYSTVKTLLSRLVGKGALQERKRANTSVYSPRVSQDEARTSALHALVARAFDGTFDSLFQHLVAEEQLDPHDRARLAEMLRELDRKNGR